MGKRYYLDLGDLVSNLFIILMENKTEVDTITYSQIGQFEAILEKEAKKRGFDLTYRLSRDETSRFFYYNKNTFEIQEDNSIIVKEGVTPIHLIYDYRTKLPFDVFELVLSEEVTNETLNMMGCKKPSEKAPTDIEYYINQLKASISDYASKMEFEKCIVLRDKLQSLQSIQRQLEPEKEDNQKVKVITKTEDN